MPTFSVTATEKYQLFVAGGSVKMLLAVTPGETFEYEGSNYTHSEHTTLTDVITHTTSNNLNIADIGKFLDPEGDDMQELQVVAGLPVYHVDFDDVAVGVRNTDKFSTTAATRTISQVNGVTSTLSLNSQSLPAGRYYVLRPTTNVKQTELLETSNISITDLSQIRVEFSIGSCGTLESDDHMLVQLKLDEQTVDLLDWFDDLPLTSVSQDIDVSGDNAVLSFRANCGEGNQEGYAIGFIKITPLM